jgi:hypothetical protein
MERVERIENLNVRGFCAQGIVSADALIPIYTAWCPVEVGVDPIFETTG